MSWLSVKIEVSGGFGIFWNIPTEGEQKI